MLGALGVVFGDIGTSPLYTVQTVFDPGDPHPVAVTESTVFGIISLIFWSVTLVVTVTYVLLVMRADNDGEGGIMALITLLRRGHVSGARRTKMLLAALGIFGASLFLGDGMITPAISVLSAVEGVEVAAPSLEHLVVPIASAILVVLFMLQRLGTATVGRLFGPIMFVWFLVVGAFGINGIASHPADPRGALALVRDRLLLQPLLDGVLRARRGRPRVHGRGGAVRRHGALRPRPDHARLAPARVPRLHAELHGPGRADPGQPEEHLQPVLPPRAGLGAVAARVPGHGRGGDRLTGGGDGRLLRRAPGDAARLPAAAACRAHVREGDRPDLRAGHQLAAARLGAHARADVQELGRAGLRVRHGRHRDDRHHDAAVPLRRRPAVERAALDRDRGRRRAPVRRGAVPRREPHEDRPRRVAAAAHRARRPSRS